jgi:hypothetical protein
VYAAYTRDVPAAGPGHAGAAGGAVFGCAIFGQLRTASGRLLARGTGRSRLIAPAPAAAGMTAGPGLLVPRRDGVAVKDPLAMPRCKPGSAVICLCGDEARY